MFNGSVYLLWFLIDLYCTLEVDSFGYFVSKAKTRVFRDTTEPQWNEVKHQNVSICKKHLCSLTVLTNTVCPNSHFLCPPSGVWDWAGGLPIPPHPVLRELLRQEQAQHGRQRDRGQDHGQRTGPGKRRDPLHFQNHVDYHRSKPKVHHTLDQYCIHREGRLHPLGEISRHLTRCNSLSSHAAQHSGFAVVASNDAGWINSLTESLF